VEIERKDPDLLIEAWRLLCAECPRAGLRRLRWRDEFVLDRSIVCCQLAAADVFVLPSRHE